MTETSENIVFTDSELESALCPENLEDVTAISNDHVEAVRRGDVALERGQVMPTTPQHWEEFARQTRRDYLLDAVMEQLRDHGVTIASYSWEGEGENTSPGSSFCAHVTEYEGLYAWFSDVDAQGPFRSRDAAIDGMCDHCNATRDECEIE